MERDGTEEAGIRERIAAWRAKGIKLTLSGDKETPLKFYIPKELVGETKSRADRLAEEVKRSRDAIVGELRRESEMLLQVQRHWALVMEAMKDEQDQSLEYSILRAGDARPERIEGAVVFVRMESEGMAARFIIQQNGASIKRLAETIERVAATGEPVTVRFLVAGLLK